MQELQGQVQRLQQLVAQLSSAPFGGVGAGQGYWAHFHRLWAAQIREYEAGDKPQILGFLGVMSVSPERRALLRRTVFPSPAKALSE